jgi:hypothetical protein
MKRYQPKSVFTVLGLLAISLFATACVNRAGARIYGASSAFEPITTNYVAKNPTAETIAVSAPIDLRAEHIGEAIAGTEWKACRTDVSPGDAAISYIRENTELALVSSGLFESPVSSLSQATYNLKTEVFAYCSEAKGFLWVSAAGIVSLNYRLERDGVVVFSSRYDYVVTDKDDAYSGSQFTFIEEAMKHLMSDVLKNVLISLSQDLDQALLAYEAENAA